MAARSAAVKGMSMALPRPGIPKDTGAQRATSLPFAYPAGQEPGGDARAHLYVEPLVEQDLARERVAHAACADPGEGPELGGPAVDQRLLGKADPRDRQRVAGDLEHERAPKVARPADDDARGVEHDVGELEAVAQLRQGEGVAVRHHPVADVALGVAGLHVHGGGGARMGRPAGGGDEGEKPHPLTPSPLRGEGERWTKPSFPLSATRRGGQGVRSHGDTLSDARIRALVESAARIAAPTPRAPGMREAARMLSRCRSVRLSPGAADDFSGLPPQAVRRKARRMLARVRCMRASSVGARPERARRAPALSRGITRDESYGNM